MSLEAEVFDALRDLVSDRVYPLTFPQPEVGLPVWPSIRFTFISVPVEDLCGDGDDGTADVSMQVDVVVDKEEGYSALRTLRLDVMSRMATLPTPARLASSRDEFDEETRTFRAILEYTVSGSSDQPADSPS